MKSKLMNVYLLYTCSFLILLPFVFFPFIAEGKSFVWYIDGLGQHYPMLLYYGNLLKDILLGKGFPMVSFNLGLGFDTITTLHYYVLGDPITLLSLFIRPENAVFLYGTLILFRFYLSGICFIIFSKYWKRDGMGVFLGALIYVFCGYSFFAGVRHPFFLNSMIYLPLVLIGLEQVLRRKKPYFMIVMVFLTVISNFYFFYMITVIAVVYVIFRYLYTFRRSDKNIVIGLILTGLRTGGYYLLGTAMAAFIFLPVLYAFFQNDRLDCSPEWLTGFLYYNTKYYGLLAQGLLAPGVTAGYWVILSFLPISAISVVILFCNKKYRQLLIIFILSFSALFVPAFGCFMNGFSYISNRWCFLISLLIAITFTMTYEKIFELRICEKILLAIGLIGYGIITFLFPSKDIVKYEFFALVITIIVILILQLRFFQQRKILRSCCLYILVCTTVGFHGYTYYSSDFYGYVDEFLEKDQVENWLSSGVLSLISDIADDSFYRIETYGDKTQNEALCVGFNDTSGYFSLLDGNITTYFKQLELLKQTNAYRFNNLDNRSILDALANVKYFVSTNKTTAPYAYELKKEEKNGSETYYLFENSLALPFGYTYDNYMLEDDYIKLSVLEKQNAMMHAAILKEKPDNIDTIDQDMSTSIEKLDIKIIPDENIIIYNNTIKVKKPGASIRVEFNSKANAETYLRFEKFNITKKASTMTSFKVKAEKEVTKSVNVRSIYHNTYFGKENYLINMGYSEKEKSWIKITFPKEETYSYGSIDVYNLDMSYYKKQCKALSQDPLENMVCKNNSIQGEVSLDDSKIMMFSIPYSKGWNAYVDGKKVDVLRGNIMYTALFLEAGDHYIVFKYETPLLREGVLITCIGFLPFIGIIILNCRRRYKNE
jgi:uncharacterized membrane protein YfhO